MIGETEISFDIGCKLDIGRGNPWHCDKELFQIMDTVRNN